MNRDWTENQLRAFVRQAYIDGFKAGQDEQLDRDFPDVGMRFEISPVGSWDQYKERHL